MKTALMNSAMMPMDGRYVRTTITKEEFVRLVREAQNLVSYVGYPQNVDLIRKWTGVQIRDAKEAREKTILADGDKALVMCLKYERIDPALKGRPVREDDFEFLLVEFKENRHGRAS